MNALTSETFPTNDPIAELYSRLNSKDEEVRTAAIAEGAALPTSELVKLAKYEAEAYRAKMRIVGRSYLPLPIISLPMWIIGMSLHWPLLTVVSFAISVAAVLRIAKNEPSAGRESIAAIISASDDPRLLIFALEIMNNNANDQRTYRLIRVAVKKLLPKLPLDGSIEWKDSYSAVLIKQLDFYDIELASRILKVFGVYGTQKTISVIEQFSEVDPGSDERKRIVRDNARRAKTAILDRLQERKDSANLLRASTPEAESLLTPASNSESNSSEELLRPLS